MASARAGSGNKSYQCVWEICPESMVDDLLYLLSAISRISLLSSRVYDLRPSVTLLNNY